MTKKSCLLILMSVSVLLFMSTFVSAQTSNNTATSQQAVISDIKTTVVTGGESEAPARAFPIGNGVTYPGLANYWGTILADGRFEPLHDILTFQNVWTEAEARALAEQDGGKVKYSVPEKAPQEGPPTKSLMFVLLKPRNDEELAKFNANYKFIKSGYFYSEGKAVSSKVFGEAALRGLQCGADLALYTEGFYLRLDAESWGFGIMTSVSVVSGGGPTSNGIGGVGGGGLGWAGAWAEYYSKPWLRVKYFRRISTSSNNNSLGISKRAPAPSEAEAKNGKLFQPEFASPPELQTGVDSVKEKEGGKKLNPGVVQP